MKYESDEVLMKRFQDGDNDALEALYICHKDRLYSYFKEKLNIRKNDTVSRDQSISISRKSYNESNIFEKKLNFRKNDTVSRDQLISISRKSYNESNIDDMFMSVWETIIKFPKRYNKEKSKFKTYLEFLANMEIKKFQVKLYTSKDTKDSNISLNVWRKDKPSLRIATSYKSKKDASGIDTEERMDIDDFQDTKYTQKNETNDIFKQAHTAEKLKKVKECFEKLNNAEQEIILKIKIFRYTFDEVLEKEKDVEKEALRKRLYRGIVKLTECVGEL